MADEHQHQRMRCFDIFTTAVCILFLFRVKFHDPHDHIMGLHKCCDFISDILQVHFNTLTDKVCDARPSRVLPRGGTPL